MRSALNCKDRWYSIGLFLLLWSLPVFAKPVKLVNVIVIDMFPVEYLDRYSDLFAADGFRRFTQDGVWFDHAAFQYGATYTAPGHATISTGSYPSDHGIVLNDWWDRAGRRMVGSVADDQASLVGDSGGASTPHRLLTGGMADALESYTRGAAKTVSLSIKDRAAIMMGGQHPDIAVWFSDEGKFVTSDYYGSALPDWVGAYNQSGIVDSYFKKVWKRLLPQEAYVRNGEDNAPWERGQNCKLSNVLPKVVGSSSAAPDQDFYTALICTPFGNELLFELGRRALDAEQLGQDSIPDFLSISLSSNDEAGHLFGPRSHELLDFTVRTDLQLAEWLKYLDEKVGLDNCLIVLTGDHGVCPAPETVCGKEDNCGRFKRKEFEAQLQQELNLRHGSDSLRYVDRVLFPWIYLNDSLLTALSLDQDQIAEEVVKIAQAQSFVEDAYSMRKTIPGDKSRIVKNGYNSTRSGDVFVGLKAHWLSTGDCTTHGTAQDYDRRVPVCFLGNGLSAQRVTRAVEIRDIAPTVCARAGIPLLQTFSGSILAEVALP